MFLVGSVSCRQLPLSLTSTVNIDIWRCGVMSRRHRIKGVATDQAFHALQEQRFQCERGAPVGVDLRLCYFQYLLHTQEPINGKWGNLKRGNRSYLTVSTPCGRILLFLCAQISVLWSSVSNIYLVISQFSLLD